MSDRLHERLRELQPAQLLLGELVLQCGDVCVCAARLSRRDRRVPVRSCMRRQRRCNYEEHQRCAVCGNDR